MASDQFWTISTPDQKYFVWSQCNGEADGDFAGLGITLVSGLKAWRGEVSKERLIEMADGVDFNVDEYVNLTKQAFGTNVGKENAFAFDVKIEGGAKFIWKKRISDKIQYELGEIDLHLVEDGPTTVDTLLQRCSDRFSLLSNRVQTLEDDNLRLAEERKYAMERLTEATEAKADLEEKLLEPFRQILNSKKRRIMELTEEIDRLQEKLNSKDAESIADDAAASPPKTKGNLSTRPKRVRDDNDEDTDEEREQFEHAREAAKQMPNLDDLPLILTTSGNAKRKRPGDQNGATTAEEDELFVPKKRQRRPRGGHAEQPVSSRTRQHSTETTPQSSPNKSIDSSSPRQTRSSGASLSKLT